MTRQLRKIKKGTLAIFSLIIVSAIVGFMRLGSWLGSGKNSETQNANFFTSSAKADTPSCDGGWQAPGDCSAGDCSAGDCGAGDCGDCCDV